MFVDASAKVRHFDPRTGSRCAGGPIGDGAFSDHLADCDIRGGFGDLSQTSASVDESEQDVGEFLEIAGVRTAPITDKEAHTALAAFFSLR